MANNRIAQLTLFHFRGMMRNTVALFFNLIMPIFLFFIFHTIFGKQQGFLDYMIPAIITQMILTGGLVTVSIGQASYRQQGTLRHLFTTPLLLRHWGTSILTSTMALTALQAILLITFVTVFFNAPLPANVFSFAIAWFVSSLVALGFGFVIGTMAKTADAAIAVSLIVYFAMSFLGGTMMPIDNSMEQAAPLLAIVAKGMPSKYMMDVLNKTMMGGQSIPSIWAPLTGLIALALVLLGVATWRTRRQFLAV